MITNYMVGRRPYNMFLPLRSERLGRVCARQFPLQPSVLQIAVAAAYAPSWASPHILVLLMPLPPAVKGAIPNCDATLGPKQSSAKAKALVCPSRRETKPDSALAAPHVPAGSGIETLVASSGEGEGEGEGERRATLGNSI